MTGRIALFATGGTISMTAHHAGGVVPSLRADALTSAIATAADFTVVPHDVFTKASSSVTLADVQDLADAIAAAFQEGLDGAVITHGTDTIEETGFALSVMLDSDKPVVITGAMRSGEAIGPDGPANLQAALRVAASPEARGIGPLVVFADEIHSAPLVRKAHSSRPHAFCSMPFGPIGHVTEDRVHILLRPGLPALPRLRLTGDAPVVPIIMASLDIEPEIFDMFADASGIAGIVIAGVGGGHVSERAAVAVERLAKRMPVVMATRASMGETLSATYGFIGGEIDLARRGVLNAGRWRPAQARILMQLLLSQGADKARIAKVLASR